MIIQNKKFGWIDIVKIPLQCAPYLSLLLILEKLLAGLLPTLQIIVTAYFIDTAISIVRDQAPIQWIYPSLLAIIALIAYGWIVQELMKFVQIRLEITIRDQFRTAILEKRARLDYRHIENDASWDIISRIAEDPEQKVEQSFNDVLGLISLVIRVAGILTLLIVQVWWAALLITVISVPLFWLAFKSGKATYQANREVSRYKRRSQYLSKVLTAREAINERSLFG